MAIATGEQIKSADISSLPSTIYWSYNTTRKQIMTRLQQIEPGSSAIIELAGWNIVPFIGEYSFISNDGDWIGIILRNNQNTASFHAILYNDEQYKLLSADIYTYDNQYSASGNVLTFNSNDYTYFNLPETTVT